jgi:ribosomal protein L32
MAESWTERARRLERRREEERRRRRRRRALTPEQLARMGRRAARRYLRHLTGPARQKLKREIRKQKYKAAKKAFGACPTCGKANGPGHTCNMRFRERNAENLRRRMEKRGQEDYPDLWRGRQAA